jgi:hypothetical protein
MNMKNKILVLLMVLSCMSCGKMLEMDSEMVEFADDNKLDTPEDTLYSVMGIIRQMQVIADRTMLLGELRGDLMQLTDRASTDLQKVVAVPASDETTIYNNISDYYAVINNCNYYIANVNPDAERMSRKYFRNEYIAVKVFRAWTYLQLAKIYGKVPLVLTPLLSVEEAQNAVNSQYTDIQGICDYFISDLSQYVGAKDDAEVEFPQYGTVNGFSSRKFFIPLRVILGELCLWAGRYNEAATYLHDYLTRTSNPVYTGTGRMSWVVEGDLDFTKGRIANSFIEDLTQADSRENISFIPMEDSEFYGVRSLVNNVYNSTLNNNYYAQATPSVAMKEISKAEDYVMEVVITTTNKDTVRAPKENLPFAYSAGDLRLYGSYLETHVNQNATSDYSAERQTIRKLPTNFIPLYRVKYVYLLFAEALCRAGYVNSAFSVLKYGLRNEENAKRIHKAERDAAGDLINFSNDAFTQINTMGIHARGCGDSQCDEQYVIKPTITETTDSIVMVEDLIVKEMALETAFEGQRYYTLMRIAMRRNDNNYLADPVSRRYGLKNDELYGKLMNRDNWFLPINKK